MKFKVLSTAKHCTKSNISNQWLSEYLMSCEMQEVEIKDADLVFVVTCGVVKEQIEKSKKIVGEILQIIKDDAKVIFTGCVTPSGLGITDDTFVYLSPNNITNIKELLGLEKEFLLENYSGRLSINNQNKPIRSGGENPVVAEALAAKSGFAICVARGCLGQCTYCNVKKSIGSLKSYSLETIVSLFKKSYGHDIALITADDLGCWGQDLGCNIIDLLTALVDVDTNARMYLQEFNPQWLLKYENGILELLRKYPNKFSMLSVPIQSGCEHTLKAMGRKYALDKVEGLIRKIKVVAPNVKILSTLFVGFPGESESDYLESLDYFRHVNADAVWVSPYSDMESLPCFNYEDKVTEPEICQRVELAMSYLKGAYR